MVKLEISHSESIDTKRVTRHHKSGFFVLLRNLLGILLDDRKFQNHILLYLQKSPAHVASPGTEHLKGMTASELWFIAVGPEALGSGSKL